jgi:hypothetical protein
MALQYFVSASDNWSIDERQTLFVRDIQSSQLIAYEEIIAVCSQIHSKHINTLCGQNVELLNVKLAVHIVTTVRYI